MVLNDQQITLSDGSVITARESDDSIVFSGSRTGDHSVIKSSSAERVLAHWFGYAQAAEQAAEQFIKDVAEIRRTAWGTRGEQE